MAMPDNVGQGVRPAAVAGQFYPSEAGALRAMVRDCYAGPLGPGEAPAVGDGPRRVVGIVAPHAGYEYSGPCAAWAYAEAARDGRPEAAVILGVNHRGMGAPLALSPARGWQTPLGTAPLARELAEKLRARTPLLEPDARAHAWEHSLEVQVPFLQFVYGDLPILPIAIGRASLEAVLALGAALGALAREHDLLLVASTDFSHQVSAEVAARQDRLALEQIATMQPLGLVQTVAERGITMCGVLPTAVLLTAALAAGAGEARVLHYHTSGDVTGDRAQVVGYGAAAIYR
jgi:AmmeMemoRadiSam system protein B